MPSNNGIGSLGNGLVALWNKDAQQWQPKDALLWSHNPNPPITLETRGNAADAAGTSTVNAVATSTAESQAAASNVSFNGIRVLGNTTLSSSNIWTGAGTTSAYTFVIFFRPDIGDNNNVSFLSSGVALSVGITYSTTDTITASLSNTGATNRINLSYTTPSTTRDGKWHSFGVSIDGNFLAGSRLFTAFLDGVPITMTATSDIGSAIVGPQGTQYTMSGSSVDMRIAEHFFIRQYMDLSDTNNIAKFVTSRNTPTEKGGDGSAPFGVKPFAYFSLRAGDAASAFLTNRAGGRNLDSGSGALATTRPSENNINATGNAVAAGAAAATGGSSNVARRFIAATFNGTSSQVAIASDQAALPDTNMLTITCAFNTSNTSAVDRYIYRNGDNNVNVYIRADGVLIFNFNSAGSAQILYGEYYPGYDIRDGLWHSFGIGVFTNLSAGSKVHHLVFDGQYVSDYGVYGFGDFDPAFTMNLAAGAHYIGYDPTGGTRFAGDIAEFTMDASTFVDFSNAGERAKFFYNDGTPRSMGDDASFAYGFAPSVYFRLLNGDLAIQFGFNRTGRTNTWSATALGTSTGPLPLGLTYALSSSFANGVGNAASTSTVAATGAVGGSTVDGDGNAAATSTVAATGTKVMGSTAAASGTSTISAASAVTIARTASAAGTSTVAATSQTIKLVTAASTATSTPAATGASTAAATAAAAATSTATATGNALKPVTAAASGTGTATGISQPGSNGAATATSTATATGATIAAATASASATSAPSATGNSIRAATAAAAGVTTPAATGTGIRAITATASATSTPAATGAAIVASIISATGTSSVTATGVAIKPATASAIATSTVAANANTVIASTASATATSTAAATYSSGTKRMLLLGVG